MNEPIKTTPVVEVQEESEADLEIPSNAKVHITEKGLLALLERRVYELREVVTFMLIVLGVGVTINMALSICLLLLFQEV